MAENLKKFEEATFNSSIEKGVTLVEFFANWCGPCRMLSPILDKIAGELHGKVTIGKLDIDTAQQVTATYQITSVPTMILFKEGKEVGRIVGLRDADSIKEFIKTANTGSR